MKRIMILCASACIVLFSCQKSQSTISSKEPDTVNGVSEFVGDSYLPMQVGNYWRNNDENYTEITGTKTIDGELCYEFSSRIGGDAFGKNYYRIDENNKLIEKFPQYSNATYTHAQFNTNVGDIFWTKGDNDPND